MGGDDQWGNIVAGTDLIRRVAGAEAFGLTFPLLATASGEKMGKTARGAVWLDPELTTPYDYFQYWVNVDDRDVPRFLMMFTLLPDDEVARLSALGGAEIREAKAALAFEATRICHGDAAAAEARKGALAAFSGGDAVDAMPTAELARARLASADGVRAADLFVEVGLCASKGEATKLFKSGAGWAGSRTLTDHTSVITVEDFEEGQVVLRAGKKRRHRIVLVD
jgi:tyrosyl-tRNA synthetase